MSIDTGGLDLRIHAVNEERGVVEPALEQQFPGLRALHPRQRQAGEQMALHARPDLASPQVSEALQGETLEVLEDLPGGWAWVRTGHDGYLGYARSEGMLDDDQGSGGMRVQVLRAHVYAQPRVQATVLGRLSYGASLHVVSEQEQHGDYLWWRARSGSTEGFVRTCVTEPQEFAPVSEAFLRQFLGVPYLWGGRSAWGLDCSGLTQLACGGRLPRDADQQRAATLPVSTPQPGDLAFFPGHVGVMLSEREMIHANATHMRVTTETLGEGDYGRRLQAGLLGFGRVQGATRWQEQDGTE